MVGGQDPEHRLADSARLSCGRVLTYSSSSFVPAVGESVPCSRHGYCQVAAQETSGRRRRRESQPPAPRSTGELAAFLDRRPVTTVHVLRGHRFTLRVLAAAQEEGLVDVDLLSGRVALRTHDADRWAASRETAGRQAGPPGSGTAKAATTEGRGSR